MDEVPDLEALAFAKWHEIAPLIDRVQERVGDRDEFGVEPNSSLAGDDTRASPHHVSHAVRHCLLAGVDHLHAVRVLVLGRPGQEQDGALLHVAAPSSLARGALEALATAYWILHPSQRSERVHRTLRWHVQNVNDQHVCLDPLGLEESPKSEKIDVLTAQCRANGRTPDARFLSGYKVSAAMNYLVDHQATQVMNTKFAWQLCSGFAHGRQWAYLGGLSREEFSTSDPAVALVRFTSDGSKALYGPLAAMHLLEDVLRLYQVRSRSRL